METKIRFVSFFFMGETTGGGFEILKGDKTQGFISTTKKLTQ